MNVKDVPGRRPEDEENLHWPEDHDEADEAGPADLAADAEDLDEVEPDREEKELDWVISQEEAEDDWA